MKVEWMHRGTGSLDHDLRWLLGGVVVAMDTLVMRCYS